MWPWLLGHLTSARGIRRLTGGAEQMMLFDMTTLYFDSVECDELRAFIAQPPPLRDHSLTTALVTRASWNCPLALLGSASYAVLGHRRAIYDPRFLPTLCHPQAVAPGRDWPGRERPHFASCGQPTAGPAPAGVRPCWAHKDKRRRRKPLRRCELICKSLKAKL